MWFLFLWACSSPPVSSLSLPSLRYLQPRAGRRALPHVPPTSLWSWSTMAVPPLPTSSPSQKMQIKRSSSLCDLHHHHSSAEPCCLQSEEQGGQGCPTQSCGQKHFLTDWIVLSGDLWSSVMCVYSQTCHDSQVHQIQFLWRIMSKSWNAFPSHALRAKQKARFLLCQILLPDTRIIPSQIKTTCFCAWGVLLAHLFWPSLYLAPLRQSNPWPSLVRRSGEETVGTDVKGVLGNEAAEKAWGWLSFSEVKSLAPYQSFQKQFS